MPWVPRAGLKSPASGLDAKPRPQAPQWSPAPEHAPLSFAKELHARRGPAAGLGLRCGRAAVPAWRPAQAGDSRGLLALAHRAGRASVREVAPLLRTAGTESLLSGARRPDGSRAQLMVRLLEVTVIVLCASTTVHGPYRRIVPCASSSVKQDGVPPSQHPRCIHTAGCISASDHARDRDARV